MASNSRSILPTTVKKGQESPFQLLRAAMQSRMQVEIDYLLSIQKYRTRWLDNFFFLASLFGEEWFYILLISFCAWILQPTSALHVAFLLAYGVVGGNCFKNFFGLNRPLSPPVWVGSANQLDDFGFPSTHAISSLTVSSYLVLHLWFDPVGLKYSYWQFPEILSTQMAFFLAFLWTGSISFSRLYNGYHYPLDVLGGLTLGTFMLITHHYILGHLIEFLIVTKSIFVPMLFVAVGLFVLWKHPRPADQINSTLLESATLLGVIIGALLAGWINSTFNLPVNFIVDEPLLSIRPNLFNHLVNSPFLFQTARFITGGIIAAVTRAIAKKLFTIFISIFLSIDVKATAVTQAQQDAQCFVKVFSYSAISLAVGSLAPLAFVLIGISSPRDSLMIISTCAWC